MLASDAKDDGYVSFVIDLRTNISSEGVWLCIAQLPSRSKEDIEGDVPCPTNVAVLTELLRVNDKGTKPLLTQHAQPDQVPVVVCPEYAFSSSDWKSIDTLIQEFSGPLILIAGFGQCPKNGLESIRDWAGETIHCGWNDEPEPQGRSMNFGSVWVKKPNSTRDVILFGKNFLEAKIEDLKGVFKFKQLTEVVLQDLRILPFICADALQAPKAGAGVTVTQRLVRKITESHLPVLCIGSLLQWGQQASDKWSNAIDGLIQGFGDAQVALVICNVANISFDLRKGGDEWRNLSGIYVSKRAQKKGQNQEQEATAYFESTSFMAWPLRSIPPQVVFGTLSLPPYATDNGSLHPWSTSPADSRWAIDNKGDVRIQKYSRSGLQDELLLLTEVTHCEQHGQPLTFKHVDKHVRVLSQETAVTFVAHLLEGPLCPMPKTWQASSLCSKSREALRNCFACLDAVMEGSNLATSEEEKFSWAPVVPAASETLSLCAPHTSLAIWWSTKDLSEDMLTELRVRTHQRMGGAALQVFGRGADGDFQPKLWKEICTDITLDAEYPVASGETAQDYSDLLTVEATPIHHLVRAKAIQPFVKLSQVRSDKPDEFKKSYGQVIQSVKS